MKIKIITCNAISNEDEMKELNSLLSSAKILDINQSFFSNGTSAYWSFCIKYLENYYQPVKEKIDTKKYW